MSTRNLLALPASLLVAALLGGCGQAGGQAAPLSQEVTIKTSEWKFDPGSFRVEAGKPNTIVLRNAGLIEHDLAIQVPSANGNDVRIAAGPGQSASTSFMPEKPGIYQFVCTLPGHKEAGMVGKVEVVAASAR